MRNHAPLGWAGLALSLVLLGGAASAHAQGRTDGDGWLGIFSQSLTPELREGLDYRGEGVLVNRVIENSPAERAGIEKGDVIVSVDRRPVESPDDLSSAIRSQSAGDRVSIRIVRNGQRRTLEARLSGRPGTQDGTEDHRSKSDEDRFEARIEREREDLDPRDEIPDLSAIPDRKEIRRMIRDGKEFHFEGVPGRAKLGVRVEDAGAEVGRGGAQVVEVLENTPAERAGIEVGDVITRVEGQSIGDASDLIQTLQGKTGRVEIDLRRRGSRRTVEVELEAAAPSAPRAPHVMRRKSKSPHVFEWRGESGAPQPLLLDDGKSTDELRRELGELRRELEDLRKELAEMKRER